MNSGFIFIHRNLFLRFVGIARGLSLALLFRVFHCVSEYFIFTLLYYIYDSRMCGLLLFSSFSVAYHSRLFFSPIVTAREAC